MDSFKLLLVLLDTDKNILVNRLGKEYLIPTFDNYVGDNVGFDDPQPYNNFYKKVTGVSVYRRYSFNTQNYVVFVFEKSPDANTMLKSGVEWVSLDDFLVSQQDDEIYEIVHNIGLYYNKSVNMPWVNENGFFPYFIWLHEVCNKNKIKITGKIKQVKNAYVSTVFSISSDTGNLYMKIPGKVYITELPFTYEMKMSGMINYPVWVDYNSDLNVFLMKDMGGNDLPDHSDIEILKNVIVQLARTQKESIQLLPLDCKHNDYRLKSILNELHNFSQRVFDILDDTEYKITSDDHDKLDIKIHSAIKLLESLSNIIPDTIQNGDVRPGNIRLIGDKVIFYDWAWGSVSHPFIDLSTFLHIIRRSLSESSADKELLVDAYLNEWLEYGTKKELKSIFLILDDLKELFMVYPDYFWVRDIYLSSTEPIEAMSADGWLLERRNYYLARVLRRFINK